MLARISFEHPIDRCLEELCQLEMPIDIFINLLYLTMSGITSYSACLYHFKVNKCYDFITNKLGFKADLKELCDNLIEMSLLYKDVDNRKLIHDGYIDIIHKNIAVNENVGKLVAYLLLDKRSRQFCFAECLANSDAKKSVKNFFRAMYEPKRYSGPIAAKVWMSQVVIGIKHALKELGLNPLDPMVGLSLVSMLTSEQMNKLLMMCETVESETTTCVAVRPNK